MPDDADAAPLQLLWATSTLSTLRARLAALGLEPDGDRYPLGPVDVVVLEDPSAAADRLVIGERSVERRSGPRSVHGMQAPRLEALGWATVDISRAVDAFGRAPEGGLREDVLLGARVQKVISTGALALVLLEPTTEGPLAAALARHGEGPVALYLSGAVIDRLQPLPTAATAVGSPGRLAWTSRSGPFVVLVGDRGRGGRPMAPTSAPRAGSRSSAGGRPCAGDGSCRRDRPETRS